VSKGKLVLLFLGIALGRITDTCGILCWGGDDGQYLAVRAPKGEIACLKLSLKLPVQHVEDTERLFLSMELFNLVKNEGSYKAVLVWKPDMESIVIKYDDAQKPDTPTDEYEYRIYARKLNIEKVKHIVDVDSTPTEVLAFPQEALAMVQRLSPEQKAFMSENQMDFLKEEQAAVLKENLKEVRLADVAYCETVSPGECAINFNFSLSNKEGKFYDRR
jgi:hypothetical protein